MHRGWVTLRRQVTFREYFRMLYRRLRSRIKFPSTTNTITSDGRSKLTSPRVLCAVVYPGRSTRSCYRYVALTAIGCPVTICTRNSALPCERGLFTLNVSENKHSYRFYLTPLCRTVGRWPVRTLLRTYISSLSKPFRDGSLLRRTLGIGDRKFGSSGSRTVGSVRIPIFNNRML